MRISQKRYFSWKQLIIIFMISFAVLPTIAQVQTTHFSFSSWDVKFYPNHLGVWTKVCNVDSGGSAGSFDFQFRFVKGKVFYVVGSRKIHAPKNPGICTDYTGFRVALNLKGIPSGQYEIWVDLAEKTSNGRWTTVEKVKLNKDWVQN